LTQNLHTLPNGFRIVTEAMAGLRSASIGLWVEAGGRHETPAQNGIAHFLEHMAFKGTRRRSALRIAEEIEDVGGYINAYTSREMTAYYARVLSGDVVMALDVIADIVLNPVFRKADIETERHVILQEIGQALDTPDDIIFDWLHEVSYPDQPFGRTILGPQERVSAFRKADFEAFTGAHYSPDQMILSAAGGVDHAAIVAAAERIFGGLRPVGAAAVEPARFLGGERREVRDLEQVHFALAFEGPGHRDDRVYAAQVYATAMGGGMSSRLFQKLREDRGLCYAISAQASACEDTGQITIYAGTSEAEIGALTTLTLAELKRAADDMTEAEVARARATSASVMSSAARFSSARVRGNARLLSIWGRVPEVAEAVRRIDAVDTGMVRAYAADLTTARAALAIYGPVSGAPGLAEIRRGLDP